MVAGVKSQAVGFGGQFGGGVGGRAFSLTRLMTLEGSADINRMFMSYHANLSKIPWSSTQNNGF